MESVAARIKRLRQHLGLTQEQLGARAGCTKSAVSQWERGITLPERDTLLALQKKNRVNPEWITNGSGDMLLAPAEQQNKLAGSDKISATDDASGVGTLTDEELAHIKRLRCLSPDDRARAFRVVDALAPPSKENGNAA